MEITGGCGIPQPLYYNVIFEKIEILRKYLK
jgi:hypothetical protein